MSADTPEEASAPDPWSTWVLDVRHGGDAAFGRTVRGEIAVIAGRVIDGARLAAGATLLDLGTGEGLLAWRAIERFGPTLQVILTDISPQLLEHARLSAAERGVQDQCRFLNCRAEQLSGVADASVDAVSSRAVLAYVADKRAALREIHRVLKPGGRLSIAEPVFRDDALKTAALRQLVEAQAPERRDRLLALLLRWRSAQFPDTPEKIAADPMTNYTERDLVAYAHECGYADIHLELHIDLAPSRVPSWDVFAAHSPHPRAPSLRTLLEAQFDAQEAQLLEQALRPGIESGESLSMDTIAYLQATKPAART